MNALVCNCVFCVCCYHFLCVLVVEGDCKCVFVWSFLLMYISLFMGLYAYILCFLHVRFCFRSCLFCYHFCVFVSVCVWVWIFFIVFNLLPMCLHSLLFTTCVCMFHLRLCMWEVGFLGVCVCLCVCLFVFACTCLYLCFAYWCSFMCFNDYVCDHCVYEFYYCIFLRVLVCFLCYR